MAQLVRPASSSFFFFWQRHACKWNFISGILTKFFTGFELLTLILHTDVLVSRNQYRENTTTQEFFLFHLKADTSNRQGAEFVIHSFTVMEQVADVNVNLPKVSRHGN